MKKTNGIKALCLCTCSLFSGPVWPEFPVDVSMLCDGKRMSLDSLTHLWECFQARPRHTKHGLSSDKPWIRNYQTKNAHLFTIFRYRSNLDVGLELLTNMKHLPRVHSQAVHQGQSCCREGFLLDKLNLSRFTSVRYGVQWSLLGSTRGSLTGCFLARSTNSFLSAEMKYKINYV